LQVDFVSIILILGIGQCLFLARQLEKAKSYYTKSLEINPENMNALEVLKQMKKKRE
jgi:Tfp pilus assembly protein PilF